MHNFECKLHLIQYGLLLECVELDNIMAKSSKSSSVIDVDGEDNDDEEGGGSVDEKSKKTL